MQEHIYIFRKELERRAAYLEQSSAHFEDIANITVDSDSVIPQGKNWNEEDRFCCKDLTDDLPHSRFFPAELHYHYRR